MKRIRVALYICLMPIATCLWSQNVGIGVASPAGKLHIKGTSDISQLIIEANGTQSTMAPLIKLKNSLGNDLLWIHSDDTSNVFLGLHAGRVNSINNGGAYNTFLGSNAGKSNISGPFNTANGAGALFSNTSGANNTTIGSVSLFSNISGSNNTASGTYSLSSNTTGSDNTSSGYGSLFSNLSGDYNTAIGSSALTFNTIGMWNTGIGSNALYFNVGGNANVALGNAALLNNTYGSSNTANGTDALFTNTIGSSNTAIGYRTLYNNTIGLHNTAIGQEALQSNVSGNKNTAIGYKSDAANDIINATAIGSNAYAGTSNTVVIGSVNGVNGATASANVGIGTNTPHSSAILELKSTSQGILFPRLTSPQRNAIVNPLDGLHVFNTDERCLNYYDSIFRVWDCYCIQDTCNTITIRISTSQCDINFQSDYAIHYPSNTKFAVLIEPGLEISSCGGAAIDFTTMPGSASILIINYGMIRGHGGGGGQGAAGELGSCVIIAGNGTVGGNAIQTKTGVFVKIHNYGTVASGGGGGGGGGRDLAGQYGGGGGGGGGLAIGNGGGGGGLTITGPFGSCLNMSVAEGGENGTSTNGGNGGNGASGGGNGGSGGNIGMPGQNGTGTNAGLGGAPGKAISGGSGNQIINDGSGQSIGAVD